MATNSILNNLSRDDMISTIKLEMGADFCKNNVFLVVEGVDDRKFLRYFSKSNVIICESYSGKKGIVEILNFFKNNQNVIGIRDRDYEKRTIDNRFFAYDYCNIEMMLINDNDAFEKVCYEYYYGKKCYKDIRKQILQELIIISTLRKLNEEQMKMWNFNKIDYTSIFNDEGLIDKPKMLKELRKVCNIASDDELMKILGKMPKYSYKKFLNITNGHDFIRVFSNICKKNNGKNIKKETITEALRCSFGKNSFQKTDLYKNIKEYQKKNKISIF